MLLWKIGKKYNCQLIKLLVKLHYKAHSAYCIKAHLTEMVAQKQQYNFLYCVKTLQDTTMLA